MFFLLSTVSLNAQWFQGEEIKGRVSSSIPEVEGIYIFNKTSKATTITNQRGEFNILVKLNDTLVFSALQYEMKFVHINKAIIDSAYLDVMLTEKVNDLAPVIVTPYNLLGDLAKDIKNNPIENPINATSLGLPNATVKRPDYLHRKLIEASSGSLYLLMNTLNGRIKRIKNQIKLQEEEKKIQATKELFNTEFYVEELKIPEDYIDRFMYFCAIDPSFKNVQDQNTLTVLEYLKTKSVAFRKLNELK